MKLIVQYVSHASVTTPGEKRVQIGTGYAVLIGIGNHDTSSTVISLLDKLLAGRFIPDDRGKINRSIVDIKGEILLVPQFTLYWDLSKGHRPGFQNAAPPTKAKELFTYAVNYLTDVKNISVHQGFFGAHMQLALQNDDPITILLEN